MAARARGRRGKKRIVWISVEEVKWAGLKERFVVATQEAGSSS